MALPLLVPLLGRAALALVGVGIVGGAQPGIEQGVARLVDAADAIFGVGVAAAVGVFGQGGAVEGVADFGLRGVALNAQHLIEVERVRSRTLDTPLSG